MKPPESSSRPERIDPRWRSPLLGAAAALILFSRLQHGYLANYDDCYYAEKAKEMFATGDWLTPHFAGHVRLDNPPLFLWLVATGFRLFGVADYGAVFFSALAGVCSVLLLVRIARRLGFDDFEAWGAGVILLATPYFLKYAQHAMMDVVLTLFFLVAIDGYLTGLDGKRRGFVQLGLATGFGVLAKSVLGFLPLAVVVVHRIIIRRFRAVTEPGLWVATSVALLVGAPWFVYQFATHGDQLVSEHFRWLIWNRGFIEPAGGGGGSDPFGYLMRIASVYWPWLPFAAGGVWMETARALDRSRDREERSKATLILCWLIVVLGTMSLGHAKKLWYVMSVFPCLGLLSARAAGRLIPGAPARRRAVTWATALLLALAALVALTPLGSSRPREPELHQIALIARTTVPAGQKVMNLDAPYWDIANHFLFYSDHDLTEPLHDPAQIREGLRQGGFALVRAERVGEIVGSDAAAVSVLVRSGSWALLTAAPPAALVLSGAP
jgi:4-amino-4-deoxy-L-arabinose transferase-like glycosyltransferase